jgi:hypothetical protein
VGVEADTREEAYEQLREDYPESRCVQLESPEDTARRVRLMEERIAREYDNPGGYYDDYDDE